MALLRRQLRKHRYEIKIKPKPENDTKFWH
jgi:hypothetical protein